MTDEQRIDISWARGVVAGVATYLVAIARACSLIGFTSAGKEIAYRADLLSAVKEKLAEVLGADDGKQEERTMSLDIYLDIEVDTGGEHPHDIRLWSGNATHNLCPMWCEAGVYDALYNRACSFAGSILPELRRGLQDMEARPDVYRVKEMDPLNKWEDYDGAVRFLRSLIVACEKHPRATIGIWK